VSPGGIGLYYLLWTVIGVLRKAGFLYIHQTWLWMIVSSNLSLREERGQRETGRAGNPYGEERGGA